MLRRELNHLLLQLAAIPELPQSESFISQHPALVSRDAIVAVIDLHDAAFRERRGRDVQILAALRARLEQRFEQHPPSSLTIEEKPDRFASPEELRGAIQKIVKFTQEPTLAVCRSTVQQDDELLRDAVLNMLADMVQKASAEGKQDIAAAFEESYQLLHRCREVGIRAAFIEKVYKEGEAQPAITQIFQGNEARWEALLAGYSEIGQASNMRAVVELIRNNTDLLSDESEALIKYVIRTRREEGNIKMAAALTEVYDILSDFREQRARPEPLPDQITQQQPDAQPVHHSAAELMNDFADAQARGDEPEQLRLGLIALDALDDRLTDRSKTAVQRLVAELLIKSQASDKSDAIEKAIDLIKKALMYCTRDNDAQGWAGLQQNLAVALSMRQQGSHEDNLAESAQYFDAALTVINKDEMPQDWARVQLNLGSNYSERLRGDRAQNLEAGLEHYLMAEPLLAQEGGNAFGRLQIDLAETYIERILGEKSDNIEEAIGRCKQALEVFSRESSPNEWFGAMSAMGAAFTHRIVGSRGENRERSIEYLEESSKVSPPVITDNQWALVQNILGWAYNVRPRGSKIDNSERAIRHIELALSVHDRERFPKEFARDHSNLGVICADRGQGSPSINLDTAIDHDRQALSVYTESDYPEDFGRTNCNLAEALL